MIDAPVASLQYVAVSLVLESPVLDPALQICLTRTEQKEKDHLSLHAGNAGPSLLKGHIAGLWSSWCPLGPNVFSEELLSI